MKKGRFLVIVFVWFFVVTFVSQTGAADEPIALKLAHFWPTTHYVHTEQAAGWIADIEAATKGRVKITVYPAESLLKTKNMYDGVIDGIADISMGIYAFVAPHHPILEIFEMPGIPYADARTTNMIVWENYQKYDALKFKDTRIQYFFCTGPGAIWGPIPFRNLNDLKGQPVMATGSTAVIMKKLGAVPVNLPRPDVYLAMERGTVKGSMAPPEAIKGFKEAEISKYVTLLKGIYNKVLFCTMSLKTWNSLPKDIQQAFDQVNNQWVEKAGKIWDKESAEGLRYGIEDYKMQLVQPSKEEYARWLELLKPVTDEFIAGMEAKGYPAKEIFANVLKSAGKYSTMK